MSAWYLNLLNWLILSQLQGTISQGRVAGEGDLHLEYEAAKEELKKIYEHRGKEAIFNPKQNGLNREKNRQNIFSTWRRRTMKKNLYAR